MDSEFVNGRVSKLLHEVAIDLVDLLYLEHSYVKSSLGFYFETVRFIGFLSHHIVELFIFLYFA